MLRDPDRHSLPCGRRGSVYVLALGLAMIVAVAAIGAMAAARSGLREAELLRDMVESRRLAESAVNLARVWIATDNSNWRNARPNGVWAANVPLDGGTFTLQGLNPNGAMNRSPTDPLILTATGAKGSARHIARVTLAAYPVPISALGCVASVSGQLHVASGCVLTTADNLVASNDCLLNEGLIIGSADSPTACQIGAVTGTATVPAGVKGMPAASVVNYYSTRGAAITPGGVLEKVVLSPASNPFGATNADGVYVIQTASDLVIRDMRLQGTLVIICPGKTVLIERAVLMEPARTDYPTLVIDGRARLRFDRAQRLSEVTTLTNFNPPDTPYQGASDITSLGDYPSEIRGLVHVREETEIDGPISLRGALICQSSSATSALKISSNPHLIYDATLYANPPAGYATRVDMKVLAGSWQQVVE